MSHIVLAHMIFDASSYSTIDDIMADPIGKKFVKDELNSNPIYTFVVKRLKYTRIGIRVRESNTLYISTNSPDSGEITDILYNPTNESVQIGVEVSGEALINILKGIDTIKEDMIKSPKRTILKHSKPFRFYKGGITQIFLGICGIRKYHANEDPIHAQI
jgi:hypothetical protein